MEVSAKAIEMVAEEIRNRGVSYDEIAEATLLSRSTISRVVKQRKASAYTVKQLVAYLELGEQYRSVVGDEPEQNSNQLAADLIEELVNVRSEWRDRLEDVKASSDAQLKLLSDQLASQQAERQREREAQEKTYLNVTTHLKTQIERLQRNNDMLVTKLIEAEREARDDAQRAVAAEASREQGDKNRHQAFIFFAIIIVAMAVALLVALGTDRVL